jgi:KaiC domain protein
MGTGKTTMALQFLMNGLMNGEKAVYMSLEEQESEIKESASAYGWDIQKYIDNGSFALIRLDPNDIKTTLMRIKNEMPGLIKKFGATRLVMDSVTLFEMMFTDDSERRLNLFEIFSLLKDTGVTAMITSEADKESLYASRYGLVEYVSDGVIILRYVRPDELRDVKLAVEVVKIRRHKHSRHQAHDITNDGPWCTPV